MLEMFCQHSVANLILPWKLEALPLLPPALGAFIIAYLLGGM